jgi:nitrite reductase/ring-hydroxylating ferredoxin subunit
VRVRVGTIEDLKAAGRLVVKAGSHGVCVVWDGDAERPRAVDDRCPHMGFPLHRGTVEAGLLTCHWHHARFDLASGGTLDPFADDVRTFPVDVEGGEVFVVVEPLPATGQVRYLELRLREGLEQGLNLVLAKSVLGLMEAGVAPADIVRTGVEFGTAYRREGWGSGLTVLVAMANLVPQLDPADRALALVHGLSFLSRDTRNHAPSFPLTPLLGGDGDADGDRAQAPSAPPPDRLEAWYRRFIETRSADAAERTLLTALAAGSDAAKVARMMTAAATDHVFLDGGHTIDFTNKAFEALGHLGWKAADSVLPALVPGTASASRAEEAGRWRHPHDLAGLVRRTEERLPALLAEGAARAGEFDDPVAVSRLGWELLADDPTEVIEHLCAAVAAGASPEQLGRALALAAGLRITRFHVQNDFGDWDTVHHGFTAANALHQLLSRYPSPELLRGVVHGALRVHLDRFLNVPAARLPQSSEPVDLGHLSSCWDEQGGVDRAGSIAFRWIKTGGDRRSLVAALGHALLSEDAGFHWYQTVEAAAAQSAAWPEGSDEAALLLAGAARFLAAHTPTRRELAHVVRTATRLRRGDDLFEGD